MVRSFSNVDGPMARIEQHRKSRSRGPHRSPSARSRTKFLRHFPEGFYDEKYLAWERGYKWEAHLAWRRILGKAHFAQRLKDGDTAAIAQDAIRIESRTNLLFSFEKMALRDAVKDIGSSKKFATGLFKFLYGEEPLPQRFNRWIALLESLPRRQTRVLTWPSATVFGFIAKPKMHFFLKPNVTRKAASRYGIDFEYQSRPDWDGYKHVLNFASRVSGDIVDLKPRDMIDIQSFLWVQGSDEYPD
jgi:hypothetical protein